jgi:hypothetical protein
MTDQDQRAVIQGLRELNAKRTQGGEIAWLESQIAETERCIKAREQAEATWSGGDSETWRSVGCKLTKAGRSAVAEKEGRIAVKYRCDLECLKNLLALANACGELLDAAERGLELAAVEAERDELHQENLTIRAERDEITTRAAAIHGENVTLRAERDAATLRAVTAELLVNHAWVHSSYANCGRDQMDSEERAAFDLITSKDLDDLYAEQASVARKLAQETNDGRS